MGGWRLHWLTKPVPRDPEPGASRQCDDRGMPDCQSGAVHSVICGTIIYKAVAGDIGVCHADCHEEDCRKAMCDQGCSSVRNARLFSGKKRRAQVGARFGQAIGLLQDSTVRCSWRTRAIRLKSTHHREGDRASCRMLVALGRTTAKSCGTLKVRASWGLPIAALRGLSLAPV